MLADLIGIRPTSVRGWRAAGEPVQCPSRPPALITVPPERNDAVAPRLVEISPICGRKNYSNRTTRPIPSRKPSPGRWTPAATDQPDAGGGSAAERHIGGSR